MRSADFHNSRAAAQRHTCRFCKAEPGAPCLNREGLPLHHQPAHLQRLRDAGIDPAKTAEDTP